MDPKAWLAQDKFPLLLQITTMKIIFLGKVFATSCQT